MNMKRRTFLKGSVAAGAVSAAVGAGLLTPRMVLAAWPTAAFEAGSVDSALDALAGAHQLEGSDKISIRAPDIAENGAVVPVSVTTTIAGAESISILAEKNAAPLTASFNLGPNTEGYVSTRIKMGKTSSVIAVVKAGGKLYSTGKEVKVTIGGCGG
ncbi:MAG TPA: thiosulfate oxidation carrier protein SoxY [Gammaproteobacteria bacterium]|nr:thiosulfate oxidation carrier protein SoxY [Gammaproteobacteria bacterium]